MSALGSQADVGAAIAVGPLSANSRHEPRVGETVRSLFDRCQGGRTRVPNEDDEKLRWFGLAGVATDNVFGTLIEGLTSVKSDRLRCLDLHDNGAFQHIDKCVRVMAMNRVCSAGRILDDQ